MRMRKASIMAIKTIHLPRDLQLKAERRARDRGFANVAEYLAELVRRDWADTIAPAALRAVRPNKRRGESATVARKRLLDGLFSYMKASEDPGRGYACGYQLRHIDRCAAITRDYLKRLASPPMRNQERLLDEIRRVVQKLNRLNASCDGALIETDQREDLCQLILQAARKAGLKSDADVTEAWREW